MKTRFTPSARLRFLEALACIRRDNALAASTFRQKAERVLRRLDRYPESGRVIPEFPDFPHREVLVPPYRFFYRTERETVWIVAVWHGAQEAGEPPR